MKIYPGKHEIVQTSSVDLNTDIPLAYVDTGFKEYNVRVIPTFSSNKQEKIIPYAAFSSLDVKLFNADGSLADNASVLQRDRDSYYYIPQSAVTFSPQRFSYTITGKQSATYRKNRSYNWVVGCVDETATMSLARNMIKVFGDAPGRGLCPSNIGVNDMDLSYQRLIDVSFKDADFVFLESPDGVNYSNGETIDYEAFLAEHANVWVSVDTFPYTLQNASNYSDFNGLRSPVLFSSVTLPDKVFDTATLPVETGVTYHNIFNSSYSGILIKEYANKGFVIMTPKSLLDSVESNVKLLYETMMYVYLNTYVSSDEVNDWITDAAPDYVVINNILTKKDKFTSNVDLSKMFGLDSNEITLANVTISEENVKFGGISNGYVVFKKEYTGSYQKYADPAKPAGAISVFTPRQNIMYYKDFIYSIEDAVQDKISWSVSGDTITVTVRPFRNSIHGINMLEETVMYYRMVRVVNYVEERINTANIYVCWKDGILNLVEKSTYGSDLGIIIAEIEIFQSDAASKIYDLRQRGGGVPEDTETDLQCLLDIGNVYGMSYRKAGSVIFTLPKRLEAYEELITKVIRKHMVAEELPIILFEDKE